MCVQSDVMERDLEKDRVSAMKKCDLLGLVEWCFRHSQGTCGKSMAMSVPVSLSSAVDDLEDWSHVVTSSDSSALAQVLIKESDRCRCCGGV